MTRGITKEAYVAKEVLEYILYELELAIKTGNKVGASKAADIYVGAKRNFIWAGMGNTGKKQLLKIMKKAEEPYREYIDAVYQSES